MTEKEFYKTFKTLRISDQLSAFLVNNPEAQAFVFIPYDGWEKDVVRHLNISERDLQVIEDEDEDDDYIDRRYLLIACDSDYTMAIRLKDVRNRLLSELNWVEAI